MKKKTISGWLLLALSVLTGTTFVASCSSDDGIDLGDLDKTIGVGGDGFSLPAGSAKDTHLGDVLDIDDSDVIDTLANGDYYFSKADTIDPTRVKVKEIALGKQTANPQNLVVPFTPEIISFKNIDQEFKIPADNPGTITSFRFFDDPTKPGYQDHHQIISLKEADIEGQVKLTIGVSVLKPYISKITLRIFLPSFFGVDESKLSAGANIVDESKSDDYFILEIKDISTNSDYNLNLLLNRLQGFVTQKPVGAENYLLVNSEDLEMEGLIKMQMVINTKNLTEGADVAAPTVIVNNVDLGEEITVTHAEGIFDPDIDIEPKETTIGDVPDFLEDENVSILLYNPQIRVNVNNNIDVKGLLDATLVASYVDDETGSKTYKTLKLTDVQPIVMNPAPNGTEVKSSIIICRVAGNEAGVQYIVKRDPDPLRTAPISGRTDSLEVFDLAAVLERIPKDLKILLDANADQTYVGKFDLYEEGHEAETDHGAGYKIEPDYEFSAPLALEAGSSIVYNDSIDGWNEDIKDNKIDFYNDAYLTVEATVENNTLFDQLVIMKPQAIGVGRDAQGNAIEISDAQVDLLDEKGNVVPKATGLTIYKTGGNKTLRLRVSGSLENLDGVKFEVQAKVTSSNSKPLNTKDDISIEKITIKLNGRITIDLDK